MGRVTADILRATDGFELVAGVENISYIESNDSVNSAAAQQMFIDTDPLPDSDIWIDFSIGEAVAGHVEWAAKSNTPIVIAATGYNSDAHILIHELSTQIPILVAPNLSTGMALMDRVVDIAASGIGSNFDPAIFELHHTGKKDAPSGTAKKLAKTVEESCNVEPQVVSLRAGGAIGEHRIHFVGKNEELIITHRATSRNAFASGIPAAVRFLTSCKPGLYTMQDVIGGE